MWYNGNIIKGTDPIIEGGKMMLYELRIPKLRNFWYFYGSGFEREFRSPGDAIRHLQRECKNSNVNISKYRIVINEERESVRLRYKRGPRIISKKYNIPPISKK